jgi:cyanate lyase
MQLTSITEQLFAAKKKKGLTFADIAAKLGLDEVCVAAIFYRQATASEDEARTLAELLSISHDTVAVLTDFPSKGLGPTVPTDPFIYRFYEIMQVYGMPLKSVVQEKFGDGIMSAIDFTLHVDREESPAGARVKVTMNGKFLPYKKW